ncbi:MAG TPA: hypothetical protein VEC10_05270, partial [Steroidobacteraceae bacterium]|nr:hypothetical protein [Steroidobacteraceae bacterium]
MNTNKPRIAVAAWAVLSPLLLQLATVPAHAQTNYAYWQTNSDGNWSNASNWQCYNPNFSSCVPSAGYEVQISGAFGSGETVTLDQSATVASLFGAPDGGLSGASMIVAGTSLTATDNYGVPSASFNTLTVKSGGSVTSASGISAVTLNATAATLSGPVMATTADISNSTVSSLGSQGFSLSTASSLTLDHSTVGPNGGAASGSVFISDSTVTGHFGVNVQGSALSTISGSTFTDFAATVQQGATLHVTNSTLGSSGGEFTVDGGAASFSAGTTYGGSQSLGLKALHVQNGGTLTLDGAQTFVGMAASVPNLPNAINIDSTDPSHPSEINVQGGAALIGVGAQLLIGNGSLNITSGGTVFVGTVGSAGSILVSGTGAPPATALGHTLEADNVSLVGAVGGPNGGTSTLALQNAAVVEVANLTLGVPIANAGGAELTMNGGSTLSYRTLTAANGPEVDPYVISVAGGSKLIGGPDGGDSLEANAIVTGANSSWSSGGLTVSGATLTATNGGQLKTDNSLTATDGAIVTVTGSGSALTAHDVTVLGATLQVLGAGRVTLSDSGGQNSSFATATLAVEDQGRLAVQGQGSVTTHALDVIGGTAEISDAGKVTASFIAVAGGADPSIPGSLTVNGSRGPLGALDGVQTVHLLEGGTLALTGGASEVVSSEMLLGGGATLDVRSGGLVIGTVSPPAQQGWVYVG